jgi:cytosine/adenosine deaminase-related metal-dependent hydrolase
MSIRIAAVALLLPAVLSAQTAPTSGVRPQRLVIRNAMIVDGNGTPAKGPFDITVVDNVITQVTARDPVALSAARGSGGGGGSATGTVEIDATGKYVLPGLINAHAHLQDDRAGVPQPIEYEFKIWLACGITTIRDVGSTTSKALAWRDSSARGLIVAPRILVYPQFGRPTNVDSARAHVRALKAQGVDGIKILGIDRDVMSAMEDEAHKLGLPIAHHVGVEETTAWDDIHFGTTSIEHWYGIPDAAIPDGVQRFPSYYNYNNETDRFRWAGHLWREADPERLSMVLDSMVARHVAWVPTFDIYEASRDLQRARTQPWFADYLHPTLEEYFKPDPSKHGSYFFGWSSTDETYWKENYRIWMAAVRDFERKGGLVGAGDDAGFIYQMYGFGLLRELELHQEAGFSTIKVIQHATGNNARILNRENEIGRIRPGYRADLIVVNGNPLENLKVLYPTGVEEIKDGKPVRTGGIEWTVKDGIPYHGPTLMREVKAIVDKARAARVR